MRVAPESSVRCTFVLGDPETCSSQLVPEGADEAGNYSAEAEDDRLFWNAAWTIAKRDHLTAKEV